MTVIILGAVLLAAVAVGVVIYYTPALNIGPTGDNNEVSIPQSTEGGVVGFETAVLSTPSYTALDATLFSRGLLPVQPPVGAGKQNPFQ